MAKTIALAPQRRPSSKQACASAAKDDAGAAELRGHQGAEGARLAQRVDRLDREARVAVDVVRVLGGDLVGDPRGRRRGTPLSLAHAGAHAAAPPRAGRAPAIAAMRLEHAALEHRVGELDVELVLEAEHHVHAGVRGHAGLVEVVVLAELGGVDRQPGVLSKDRADSINHAMTHRLSRASS